MVREYSAGQQQAEGGVAAQPLDLRDTTATLTQELSQLLAQSIAQGQPGKRAPGVAAAGSELANLAALVSASQNQRSHQPSFKDGLSSLSYNRPTQGPMPPPPAPPPVAPPAGILPVAGVLPSAGSLLVSEPHDEEPMPIPSTWRQPMTNDDERWYRQQLGAAGLGLIAGLIVVVPAVLWLSGWIGGPSSKAAAARLSGPETPVKAAGEVPQVKVRITTASADARVPAAPEPRTSTAEPRISVAMPVEPAPPPPRTRSLPEPQPPAVVATPHAPRVEPPARSRADDLLVQAKRLIEGRDIVAARDLLQAPETTISAPLTFMLAETYDPSMLAIWQIKPDGVTANPERARALYQRARDLGDTRAQQRLDWLR